MYLYQTVRYLCPETQAGYGSSAAVVAPETSWVLVYGTLNEIALLKSSLAGAGRGVPNVKLAETDAAVVRVTVQVLSLPEHPLPLHPLKVEPSDGEAVKVTVVLASKEAEQVEPQVIPAGLLVTVPLPAPVLLTESA